MPQGKKVRLDFEELRTEENKDFVFIYDTGKTDPIIGFSGVKDKPRAITSSGNSIRVRFISNGENVNNGFKVSYKQTGKRMNVQDHTMHRPSWYSAVGCLHWKMNQTHQHYDKRANLWADISAGTTCFLQLLAHGYNRRGRPV